MASFDQTGGDLSGATDPSSTAAGDPYAQIRQLYQQLTGGKYTPTQADLTQFGANPGTFDQRYLSTISNAIQSWWAQNPASQATTTTPTTPAATPTADTSTPAAAVAAAPVAGAPTAPMTPNAAPTQAAPVSVPTPAVPPPFNYAAFSAPTQDDVTNSPDYQVELGQGMQAIGAKNAALGTLNTGGTVKDFQQFGEDLAQTKYDDLYNQDLSAYQTNEGNALNTYNTNYGTQIANPFNYAMQAAGLTQNSNQFNASLGQNNNQFNSSLDWQQFLQNYKSTVTDPFAQKYSLLGLL